MSKWTKTGRRLALVGAIAAVAFVLLTAYGLGVFRPAAPKETVTSADWTICDETTCNGLGWFGPSVFSYTNSHGFPMQIGLGAKFTVTWSFQNNDSVNHTIFAAVLGSPFLLNSTDPTLPCPVLAHADSAHLELTIVAPSDAGASLVLDVTVHVM